MPSAEIVTIGTELLLGEITDTNAAAIARTLRGAGVDVYRKTTVGDNPQRIADVIGEAAERADVVIATGGLGPTVDDATRDGVALALGIETEFRPELWDEVQAMYRRFGREPTENNRRQAYVPRGALAIPNPVGTAPGFIAESKRGAIVALPGVPREMTFLLERAVLPYLRERFAFEGVIVVRVLHTVGAGESQIDDRIGDLEAASNPTVGLAAHAGQVDVRVTAKAESEAEAEAMLDRAEAELRTRLGRWVFGVDGETLGGVVCAALETHGWRLAVLEAGTLGAVAQMLGAGCAAVASTELTGPVADADALSEQLAAHCGAQSTEVGLGVAVSQTGEEIRAFAVATTPNRRRRVRRRFGGHPDLAPQRTAALALELLRRTLVDDGHNRPTP